MTESTGRSLQEDDMPKAKEHGSLLRAVIKSIARIPQDDNTREAEELRSLRRSLTESIEDFPQEDGTPENKDPEEHELPYSNLNNEHRLAEIERCTNAGQIVEILDKEGVLTVQVGRWRRRYGRAKEVGSKSSIIEAFMHEITDAFVTESIEPTPRADNAPVATASRSLLRSLAETIGRIQRQAVRPEANELHSLLQALGDSIEDSQQDDSAPEGGHELRYFDADRERRILKQVGRCNNVTQILEIFDREGISTAKISGWRRQRVKSGELHVKRRREAKDMSSITTVNDPGSSLVKNPGRPLMMPHATSGEPLISASSSMSLADFFSTLRRRKWILMGVVGALLALTTVVLFMLTPRYEAEASIMVDGQERVNIGLPEVMPNLPMDSETIASEIEVLLGRSMVAKVVDGLKLEQDPEFNAELQPKTEFAAVIERLKQTVTGMFRSPEEVAESDAQRQARERAAVINTFIERLSVAPKGRSRVITVAFASSGAEKASNIANAVAALYIGARIENKLEAARQTTEWLDERIATVRKQVEDSEKAVEKYRRESGLIQGRDGTLVAHEISELNTQLVQARAERAAAQARLREQRRGLTSAGGSADSISEVLGSSLIQRLREQETELARKSAELSEDLGAKHPIMLQLQAERRDLQTKVDVEIGKISRGLQHEADIASAREYAFQSRLRELEKQVAKSNESDVQLRALQAEADANKVLLETFLTRTKESNSQQYLGARQADAHVISYADAPIKPSYPRKALILALAFVVSLFIALAFIYVIEELDPGFRSSEQIERATGLPALGSIPKFGGFGSIGKKLESYILKQPRSAITESFHALYTSIRFSTVGVPPRTVLIASSLPLEGKTTIALCLSRLWALTGQQVLIVDADLRTPKIHSTLGIKREPGLIEILDDEISLDDAIRIDEASGACVICAGRPVTNPNYYINSERLDVLLDQLANKFDLVILDSPPVMAVADTRVLATKVDTTVYIAKWASTRREIVKYGIKMIASAGGRISGVVLAMVDSKIHAASRFPDAAAYYTSLNKYYMKLPKHTQTS
ncbi:MAG: GumC family protein [Chromatiales bacterium]